VVNVWSIPRSVVPHAWSPS